MPSLKIQMDATGIVHGVDIEQIEHVKEGIVVGGLAEGMESGAASVAMRIDLPDGRVVLAETSLALFLSAADALRVRYGDPRT